MCECVPKNCTLMINHTIYYISNTHVCLLCICNRDFYEVIKLNRITRMYRNRQIRWYTLYGLCAIY